MPDRLRKKSRAPRTVPAAPEKAAYFNRELSWLAFNRRVLEQAQKPAASPAGAGALPDHRQLQSGRILRDPGRRPHAADGFRGHRARARRPGAAGAAAPHPFGGGLPGGGPVPLLERATWPRRWPPRASTSARPADLAAAELNWVRAYFREQVYPVLTPARARPGAPFPQLGNKTLNVVVSLGKPARARRRAAWSPSCRCRASCRGSSRSRRPRPGRSATSSSAKSSSSAPASCFPATGSSAHAFRVTRNSDLYIDEEEAENLLKKIEEELRNLRRGAAVRLEIEEGVGRRDLRDAAATTSSCRTSTSSASTARSTAAPAGASRTSTGRT